MFDEGELAYQRALALLEDTLEQAGSQAAGEIFMEIATIYHNFGGAGALARTLRGR